MLLPCPYKLSGEYSDVFLGLLSMVGIPLRSSVCLNYEGFGFVLGDFHTGDISIELACVLAYELVAFPDLDSC